MTAVREDASTLALVEVDSPVGRITAAVRGDAVCAMAVGSHWARLARRFAKERLVPREDPTGVASRLRAYFATRASAIVPVTPSRSTSREAS